MDNISNMETDPAGLRSALVDHLMRDGFIKSPLLERAFRKVPRHVFLPGVSPEEVYTDGSIVTKSVGAVPVTSSTQPSLMASMLEILAPQDGSRVLEIGTGTGYNAAILAEMVRNQKKVFTVDIDPDNIVQASLNLKAAGYPDVTAQCYNGWEGFPAGSPYDRILATCSIKDVPAAWPKQLNAGGIIVAPVWINGTQVAPALVKKGDCLVSAAMTMGGFMNLRTQNYQEIKGNPTLQKTRMLLCSEHQELFHEGEVGALLAGNYREVPPLAPDLSATQQRDFYVYIALNERLSVELFLDGNAQNLGFSASAAGIVDCANKSACMFSGDGKMLAYGSPHAHERLQMLFTKWRHLGSPSLEQWQVLVYPKTATPQIAAGDVLLSKESSLWLARLSQ